MLTLRRTEDGRLHLVVRDRAHWGGQGVQTAVARESFTSTFFNVDEALQAATFQADWELEMIAKAAELVRATSESFVKLGVSDLPSSSLTSSRLTTTWSATCILYDPALSAAVYSLHLVNLPTHILDHFQNNKHFCIWVLCMVTTTTDGVSPQCKEYAAVRPYKYRNAWAKIRQIEHHSIHPPKCVTIRSSCPTSADTNCHYNPYTCR